MQTTPRFRVSSDVVTRDVPDGAMLVNIQTGAAFKLNHVGSLIWRQLDGTRDVVAIVAEIQRTFGVEADLARRDLALLLKDLQKQDLIGLAAPP